MQIDAILRPLDPRQRFIALCLAAGYLRCEIGDMLGVSARHVSQIAQEIQRALRAA